MTCKDCIHDDVCEYKKIYYAKYDKLFDYIDIETECKYFKDKASIIELPNVEIGQELFYIDRYTKIVESDIVSRLNWEETDLGVQTGIWSENNAFSEFFSDVGKTLFLTKEEAEARLKELS